MLEQKIKTPSLATMQDLARDEDSVEFFNSFSRCSNGLVYDRDLASHFLVSKCRNFWFFICENRVKGWKFEGVVFDMNAGKITIPSSMDSLSDLQAQSVMNMLEQAHSDSISDITKSGELYMTLVHTDEDYPEQFRLRAIQSQDLSTAPDRDQFWLQLQAKDWEQVLHILKNIKDNRPGFFDYKMEAPLETSPFKVTYK